MSFFINIVVGFFAAILSSMGLGAGSILILYLLLVENFNQIDAQGINLLFSIPVALVSIYFHYKNKMLLPLKECGKISILGGVGAIIGSFIAFSIEVDVLKKLFSLFLFYIGVKGVFVLIKNLKNNKKT